MFDVSPDLPRRLVARRLAEVEGEGGEGVGEERVIMWGLAAEMVLANELREAEVANVLMQLDARGGGRGEGMGREKSTSRLRLSAEVEEAATLRGASEELVEEAGWLAEEGGGPSVEESREGSEGGGVELQVMHGALREAETAAQKALALAISEKHRE
ncbi:MAG: hypothetical protein SGPRY_013158, partial [Prymnesium sp.]